MREVGVLNEELRQRLARKINDGEFTSADLPDFLTVFCEVCNESEDVQSEVKGWNAKLQIDITDGNKFWLTVADGTFTCGSGEIEAPDTTLRTSGDVAARVFSGDKDATSAYMEGSLKIGGQLREALKLRGIIGIVLERLQG
jgi:putative sterol carrier protein